MYNVYVVLKCREWICCFVLYSKILSVLLRVSVMKITCFKRFLSEENAPALFEPKQIQKI